MFEEIFDDGNYCDAEDDEDDVARMNDNDDYDNEEE